MEVQIEFQNVGRLLDTLRVVARDSDQATRRAMNRVGLLAHREARKNAPRSPTLAVYRKATGRAAKLSKARGVSRAKPGGLERSVQLAFGIAGDTAEIFVASNSEAGKYAKRIHDDKGKSWHRRGPGTVAKGSHSDEKFIARAIYDNEGKIENIIRSEHRKEGWYELS